MTASPMSFPPRLAGKVALVTGATQGIGGAIAKLFVQHGARVIVNALVRDARAEAFAAEIGNSVGNDDNILADLLTPFTFAGRTRHIDGGLLGQWGVWTRAAVRLFAEVQRARARPRLDATWLDRNAALTDANAALFDPAHNFAGCLPGIHEILRRQGLLASTACLDPNERLSPGQAAELTRVAATYPWLVDDDFVAVNVHRWLA